MKLSFTKLYKKNIKDAIALKKKISSQKFEKKIFLIVETITNVLKRGGKILLCGNGGSAADAQHLAAELLVRLRPHLNRNPLPAISLAMDSSTMTACSNDYSFKYLFSRMLQALGNKNDLLIAISTSGNSKNIIEVLKEAKKKSIFSISMLGGSGGKARDLADLDLIIPSNETARIQECHIFLGHIIFENVEKKLYRT
jgi:D-sedoheptulose 7-phosphate isomerase